MKKSLICCILLFSPSDYFKPTFDTNTVNRQIKLSDNNRRAVHVREDQSYTDHPQRFQDCPQLLCRDEMIGRHYFVVEWSGWVDISVTNRGISRRVERADCRFGGNDQSWSLSCSDGGGYYVSHHKKRSFISSSFAAPKMIGVYVDHPAGSVSFYRICNGVPIHLHTFSTTFTEPLYLGLGFRFRFRSETDSFVCLCSLEEFSHWLHLTMGNRRAGYRLRFQELVWFLRISITNPNPICSNLYWYMVLPYIYIYGSEI